MHHKVAGDGADLLAEIPVLVQWVHTVGQSGCPLGSARSEHPGLG